MTKIIVVYHSGYGHTAKHAQAVAQGAGAALIAIDAEGNLTGADRATLEAADAVIFGSPTYMGSVSWQFKKFADASSKPWFSQKWKNKIAAGFTNSATMMWVGTGMMPANSKAAQRNDVNYAGSFCGAMMQTPSDATADEVLAGDLETGRQFGRRVAEAAQQFITGAKA